MGEADGSRTPAEGWAALDGGRWEDARSLFESDPGSPSALDGMARAWWWLSDVPAAVAAWERAYAGYRERGDDESAVRVGLFLWREHGRTLGNDAEANGWLARSKGLAAGLPDSPAGGWVRLAESEDESDPARVLELAEDALATGRRLRDPDLELAALGRVGLAEIWLGRIDEGMTRFDEAMAASTAGEPRDLRTLGDLYCTLMLAAELTLESDRFEQWNRRLFGYMGRYHHPDVLTFCGTCCAQVLVAGGEFVQGERWLTDTLAALEASGQRARCVHPATRLAALRIDQGRLEEAEELLRGHEDLPEAVQPVVALSLARGRTGQAAARLHRRLDGLGRSTLLAAPLLAQLVDVQIAQGDIEEAAATAGSLSKVADLSGSERFEASAELALGSVAVAAGEAEAAAEHLGRAVELFTRHHMPQAAARAHLVLAHGLAARDADRAVAEARQAFDTFERIGATRDADRAAVFLRKLGVGGRTGPKLVGELSRREVEVLRLLGYGLTNAEIAARLFISTKTVATHVGNVFAKLHVRNRAEAATFAQRYLSEDASST